ncbi:MAG: hypothetical protein QOI57_2832 [Rubrobacteraceae bacterium]|jgi:hypothetical protein|nr:hypothetical protein [Rubrobacteraceae bacterium]
MDSEPAQNECPRYPGSTGSSSSEKLGAGKRTKTTRADTIVSVEKPPNMFLHGTGIRHIEGYKLEVTSNNGAVKEVDLEDELYGEVFEPVGDIELFKQVAINEETNTLEWPNGADFTPEFLMEINGDRR